MLRQEERATVSLRSFGSLIRVTGRKAKIEEAQIDSILNELKQGNFQRLSEFEKLVDDLLNNILENIKVYAQRDENKKIEMIYQFISNFFNHHLFDALDNKTINEIKSAFDKGLNQLISNLRQEKRDERTIRHGRKPVHTIFKRMFRSNKSLDRQVMRTGRRQISLEHKEDDVERYIENLLLLNKRRGLTQEEKEYVKKALLALSKILLQEFEAIHEEEVDVEIQEADLIHEIDDIIKLSKNNPIEAQKLQKIKEKIESHCRTDLYVAKRIFSRAKSLKEGVDVKFKESIKKGKIVYSYNVLTSALRGFEFYNVLFNRNARQLFLFIIGLEREDKPEKKMIGRYWNERSLMRIIMRMHELMENYTILNAREFRSAGGYPKLKELFTRLMNGEDVKDRSALNAWIRDQVKYGHPYALLAEHLALHYLYQRLERKNIPVSVFLLVNPMRIDDQFNTGKQIKDFERDPVGRLLASFNPQWFHSKLLDEEPTTSQIEDGISFIEKCGYTYKTSKEKIIEIAKVYSNNNFSGFRDSKPWFPPNYPKE